MSTLLLLRYVALMRFMKRKKTPISFRVFIPSIHNAKDEIAEYEWNRIPNKYALLLFK